MFWRVRRRRRRLAACGVPFLIEVPSTLQHLTHSLRQPIHVSFNAATAAAHAAALLAIVIGSSIAIGVCSRATMASCSCVLLEARAPKDVLKGSILPSLNTMRQPLSHRSRVLVDGRDMITFPRFRQWEACINEGFFRKGKQIAPSKKATRIGSPFSLRISGRFRT